MKKIFEQYPPLLLFLTATIFFIWLSSNRATEDTSTPLAPPLLVAHNSQNYQYNEQGQVRTSLIAKTITYYNDERGTDFISPIVSTYKGNISNRITADTANQNQDKSLITLNGNVIAIHQNPNQPRTNTRFESPNMRYYPNENRAETDEAIKIFTPDSTTYAIGTIWQINQNLFILKKNVRSTYEQANRS